MLSAATTACSCVPDSLVGGLNQRKLIDQLLEPFTVFGLIYRVRRCTDDRHTGGRQLVSQFQRCLPAELNDDALGLSRDPPRP